MTESLVICVGNPYRRDDGVGLAVLAALPEHTRAVESTGEPTALLNLWAGMHRVVLVDAMTSGARPGAVHVMSCRAGTWDTAPPSAAASTHGLGVADAVALGSVLGNLPPEVVLIGVEVGDTSYGQGLSDEVAAAVPDAAAAVMAGGGR